jgi:hypothetical protein
MHQKFQSTWSRLSRTLRERLRKAEPPSIDSILRSFALFGVVTPEHLAAIHNTNPKAVQRLLNEITKVDEPLVRPVGSSPSGPLQQCYLLTKAGSQKVGCNRRMKFESAQRPTQAPRLPAPIYMVHRFPHGQTPRTPDLIIAPDGAISTLEDPVGLSLASVTDGRWGRLQRFLDKH